MQKDGKVIIPTYVSSENRRKSLILIAVLEKIGVKFKEKFDFKSYKEFYSRTECGDVEFILVEGKIPCAIAIIKK